MTAQTVKEWTAEQLASDAVSKKTIVEFLHQHATYKFLKEVKLFGKVASITKGAKKLDLIAAYDALYETQSWRPEGVTLEDEASIATAAISTPAKAAPTTTESVSTVPLFTKSIIKKGTGQTFPRKGSTVSCWYTGTLEDGTVFDTNIGKKKPYPLRFKVGASKVIRGWDEGIQTMCVGEKARLVIESEWAYGKKGLPEAK
ncbi:hypothetical protein BATDEDRAFT_23289 [Batrachochytrium dendrobatidis JAM81]|uniref:peptidylprolyl isomerase n=2 Tax=Batrachochytrium dendrobatidis TaxID=109871 RepID=F4NYK1_BATDJ|nr:uncharacterized protein BATDEDRAFT_23289 [Batrachochytrium dendrobatidis JAM81]EGF82038.1 hypothetical protein BATDEDRAFT_23289 [Batrachochytrium dendrobatidis JAM81]OAJ40175.1 hypothetical protein BDEG_23938 [Batrachochytrium dendrobatidis JEL423]|eukprot:XP_006677249.1 hypothetical protein BATDEDRAFT_23289 [Batrachochytrium dendrobatidis JAM81]